MTAASASRSKTAPGLRGAGRKAFPATNGAVLAMALHGTTLYIGGKFSTVGGSKRNGLAAIDLANRSLLPWAPRVGPVGKEFNPVEVRALAVSPDGDTVYIGGHFDFITGVERSNLAAVSSEQAGAVSDWNPALSGNPYGGVVDALALDADGSTLYVGGAFQEVNDSVRSGLAAISTTTGDEGVWAPLVVGTPSLGYAVKRSRWTRRTTGSSSAATSRRSRTTTTSTWLRSPPPGPAPPSPSAPRSSVTSRRSRSTPTTRSSTSVARSRR